MKPTLNSKTIAKCSLWKTLVLLTLIYQKIAYVNGDCLKGTIKQETYFYNSTCNAYDTAILFIYEDCPENEVIFEANTDLTVIGCKDNIYSAVDGLGFGFSKVGDAEDSRTDHLECTSFLTDGTTNFDAMFYFVDVNEFPPEPANGLGTTESIEPDENTVGVMLSFYYTDADAGESVTLTATYKFEGDAADIFDIERVGPNESETMVNFNLVARQMLDYETNSFFNLQITFTSHDPRGNSSSTLQTFLVFVQDLGDNPPFFTQLVPFASCEEEYLGDVFQVKAQDRDVNINNAIFYSIISGNDDGYFGIDSATGTVSTVTKIDRESLNSTLFSLMIEAKEILANGTTAPPPNNSTEVTNVNILDINDNIPTFDNPDYAAEMDEFDQSNPVPSKNLDISIIVTDMDEGTSGQYDLTTDNPDVVLTPSSGSGRTSFGVRVTYDAATGNFDYEQHADDPVIVIKITATEVANNTHLSVATLSITLIDINDNSPIFEEDQYITEAREDVIIGSEIIPVSATDADASSQFNADSIVYILNGCDELEIIDNKTGLIDTAQKLDYETKKVIQCTIKAQDMEGSSPDSKMGSVPLTLNIIDVNDEPPIFIGFVKTIEIVENSVKGTTVTTVHVVDPDTTAALNVQLLYDDSNNEAAKSWFELIEHTNTGGDYVGEIVVLNPPDRETSDLVIIIIQAIDENSETGLQEADETLTITILDVNDEFPVFTADYSSANIDELTPVDTKVGTVTATDPDLNDEVSYSLSENPYLYIDETSGEIFVLNIIHRETTPFFIIQVFAVDLVNHTTSEQINVTVNDINNHDPVLDKDICSNPNYTVSEGDDDGTFVLQVHATDADIGKHAEIIYVIQNPNEIGYYYQNDPFAIDSATGDITINNSIVNTLDRETYPEWQLTIIAYDQCEINEPKCYSRHDDCFVSVTVTDINDNAPGDYKPVEDIHTTEFLLEGEQVDAEIAAFDPDEVNTPNSQITFEVVDMWIESSENTTHNLLFVAENKNRTNTNGDYEYYCNLVATTNLTGLRNTYQLQIEAYDHGDPQNYSSSHNYTLVVDDANDMSPEFNFEPCLESSNQTIKMLENVTAINTPLACDCGDVSGAKAYIIITDQDEEGSPNNKFMLSIYDTDPRAAADNQAGAFDIIEIEKEVKFGIIITEKVYIENGNHYNLTLAAKDKGTPPLTTYSWVYIEVLGISKYFPDFCEGSTCSQKLYITENTDEETDFQPAEDKDNEFNDPDVTPVELIYYSILSSDIADFIIPDKLVPTIKPTTNLDRERTPFYKLDILASNTYGGEHENGVENTNQVLHVSVTIMDVNDNPPTYNGSIYGDFLETGIFGSQVAVLLFDDPDLNETLTYTIDQIVWNAKQDYVDPFSIQAIDNRSSEILLNMDPTGKFGYCNFIVYCSDNGAVHTSQANAQVFVVTTDDMVPFLFANDVKDVQNNKDNIAVILTNAFGYTCVIDSIYSNADAQSNPIANQTVVLAHFIGEVTANAQPINKINVKPKQIERIKRTENSNEDSKTEKNKERYDEQLIQMQQIMIGINENDDANTSNYWNYFTEIIQKLTQQNNREKISFSKDLTESEMSLSEKKKKNLLMNKNTSRNPPYQADNNNSTIEYQLIPKTQIEIEATDGAVASQLVIQFSLIGLNLLKIGDFQLPDSGTKVVGYKIALGAITLVLGLLVILLLITYIVQTKKLKRQVKVLSTNTFGSKSSDIDKAGLANGYVVPGSNQFANQGANPMFNLEETATARSEDAGSVASWDSILVGVEDNPEFKGFKNTTEHGAVTISTPTHQLNSVEQEIDPFSDVNKFNPLFGIANDNASDVETISKNNLPSDFSEENNSVEDNQLNSQFSFL